LLESGAKKDLCCSIKSTNWSHLEFGIISLNRLGFHSIPYAMLRPLVFLGTSLCHANKEGRISAVGGRSSFNVKIAGFIAERKGYRGPLFWFHLEAKIWWKSWSQRTLSNASGKLTGIMLFYLQPKLNSWLALNIFRKQIVWRY
jgi:hypothetical protein